MCVYTYPAYLCVYIRNIYVYIYEKYIYIYKKYIYIYGERERKRISYMWPNNNNR